MDTRTCWFVVEEQEESTRLSLLYPGRILLLDRSYIHDTQGEKALDGTTLLHEVISVAKEVPTNLPRIWPALVANLPCNCKHCTVTPINTECSYSPWRKARLINVVEALKEGEVAEHVPFEGCSNTRLKELLKGAGLTLGGNKVVLISRLIEANVQDRGIVQAAAAHVAP